MEIRKILSEFFPDIEGEDLIRVIAENAIVKQIKRHEVIMDHGSKIKFIPLLFEGKIKVFKEDEEGRELFLYFIHPGQGCAVSFSCFDKLSTIRAQAVEDSKVVAIPIDLMEKLTSDYPAWDRFVLRIYNQRFEELLDTVNDIAFHKLDERLLDYLEKQSYALETKKLPLTHADIAMDLNTSREVVSRLLKKLEKDGVVVLSRNEVGLVK